LKMIDKQYEPMCYQLGTVTQQLIILINKQL